MPLELTECRQRDDFSCGSAVYTCVTRYWEGRGRRLKADPLHGTPPDQLEPAFRGAGYYVVSGEMDVSDLRFHVGQGRPVVALIQSEGTGHWVVVRHVTRQRVYLMDPAAGFRWLPVPEFEAAWCDSDRRGTVFRRHALAVWC